MNFIKIIKNIFPSKLIIQIIITFCVIFGFGTFVFIKISRHFNLEILNSYFSLLSSLTTIFAALVAVFVTQDFRKQKRAELLQKLSLNICENITELYEIMGDIDVNFQIFTSRVEQYENFNELNKLLDIFLKHEGRITILSNQVGYLYKIIPEKKLIDNCEESLKNYKKILYELRYLQSLDGGYNQEGHKDYFDRLINEYKQTIKDLPKILKKILELFSNYYVYKK